MRKHAREPFIMAALLAVTVLHTLASVSRPNCAYLLTALQVVIYGAFMYDVSQTSSHGTRSLSAAQQAILNTIPTDMRTVINNLDLEPEYMLYACCPGCFALYPPNPNSPKDPYPHRCTHKPDPGGRCVQHLTGTNGWEAGSLETYQIVSLPKPVFLGSRIVLPRGFRGYTG